MSTKTLSTFYCAICDTVSASIANMNNKRLAYIRFRNSMNELSGLTNNELRDIGISLGDINFIASCGKLYRGGLK